MSKITINNKQVKYMGIVHKREIMKGGMPLPDGYEIVADIRKIKQSKKFIIIFLNEWLTG